MGCVWGVCVGKCVGVCGVCGVCGEVCVWGVWGVCGEVCMGCVWGVCGVCVGKCVCVGVFDVQNYTCTWNKMLSRNLFSSV